MREILFRGKRIATNTWVEGSLLNYGDGDYDICAESDVPGELNKYAVYPKTIGQYTGLKDKKGNKIFEGDIVKFGSFIPGAEEYMGEVNWDYSLFDEYKYVWDTKCEVVGNIHDNVDLLI